MLKQLIQSKYNELTNSQKLVTKFIIQEPEVAAFLTAEQIGSRVGVSESTVIRLAGFLGFSSFVDFKAEIQKYLMENLSAFDRYRDYKEVTGTADILSKVIYSAQRTIALTQEHVDRKVISELVNTIVCAPSLYIFAQKSSYALAYYFSYYLSWFLPNTHLLESHLAYERIANADKKTLVIGISFPRFTRWTTELLQFASEEGVQTASITNEFTSPLSKYSNYTVSVPWDPVSFIDSFTAPLCVINTIIISVAHEMGDISSRQLANLERIWSENGIYVPGF